MKHLKIIEKAETFTINHFSITFGLVASFSAIITFGLIFAVIVYVYKKHQKIQFQNEQIEMSFILTADETTLPQTTEISNSHPNDVEAKSVKTSNFQSQQGEDAIIMDEISNTIELPYQPVTGYNLRTKTKKK